MSKKVALLGAGGLARDVVDILQASGLAVAGYIVDCAYGEPGTEVYGYPILGDMAWLASHLSEYKVINAVGESKLRYRFGQQAEAMGAEFISAIYPGTVLSPSTVLGQGVIIKAGCFFGSQTRLGKHTVLNFGCTVGHDSVLEDYVLVSAGVNIAGYVKIGQGSYLGLGCRIIDHLEIGEGTFVGSGSVVTKPLPAHVTAAGTPARVIRTSESAELSTQSATSSSFSTSESLEKD